jgi:hypothetical protein
MDKQLSYVEKVKQAMTVLAQVLDTASSLEKVYFDRGYNAGGTAEITDPAIHPYTQVSADDLALSVTLLSQFRAFCMNEEVKPGDRASTLNKLRNDF